MEAKQCNHPKIEDLVCTVCGKDLFFETDDPEICDEDDES